MHEIDKELEASLLEAYPQGSRIALNLLAILPKNLQEFIVTKCFHGGNSIFLDFRTEIVTSTQTSEAPTDASLDLVSILSHEILSIIPVCGLTWSHTGE
jgi:hypothetical protein